MMGEVFGDPWLSQTYASLPLQAAAPVLTNEFKAYLAASVLDDRKADAHNDAVMERYAAWYGTNYGRRRQSQTRQWIQGGEIVTGEYHSPEVQLFGDIHRFAIINRAQMAPMHDRDIVLLNDLYSEEDTRFRDRQRRSDTYINFLDFKPLLRPLMRGFLLDKVAHGECAPRTVIAMRSRLRLFAQFLHEESVAAPMEINELTMERYLA